MIERTSIDATGWSEELARDRKIISTALDCAALEQAELFCKWAERAAVAASDEADLKVQMDRVENELQVKVRANLVKFGLKADSPIPAIKAKVETLKRYIAAQDELLKIKRISAFCDVAANAMETRRKMLELLDRLQARAYFAAPKFPRNLTEELKKYQSRRGDDVEDRQSRVLNRHARGDSQ